MGSHSKASSSSKKHGQKSSRGSQLTVAERWWESSESLQVDVQNTAGLSQEMRDKLNMCMCKIYSCSSDPDALAKVRREIKTILAGYPHLVERVDDVIFEKGSYIGK
ncbi:hypothetical protein OQA88_5401 [Cercophora sp. LCS_1]